MGIVPISPVLSESTVGEWTAPPSGDVQTAGTYGTAELFVTVLCYNGYSTPAPPLPERASDLWAGFLSLNVRKTATLFAV